MNTTEDEARSPKSEVGSTEPTPANVATARRLLKLHREIDIPRNNFCAWCLKPWPCAEVRWSRAVIAREGCADG